MMIKLYRILFRISPFGWYQLLTIFIKYFPKYRLTKVTQKDGLELHLDLSLSMCHPLFFKGEAEHNYGISRALKMFLRPNGCLIDVGANIGQYIQEGAKRVGVGGQIVGFEPLNICHEILMLNSFDNQPQETILEDIRIFKSKKFGANVTLFNCAVSNSLETKVFYEYSSADESSFTPVQGATTINVKAVPLDIVFEQITCCDLIKIDVEGYEFEVIEGAQKIISTYRPVICFEFLVKFSLSRNIGLREYLKLFQGLNYELFWLSHSKKDRLISEIQTSDIIAFPAESIPSFIDLKSRINLLGFV